MKTALYFSLEKDGLRSGQKIRQDFVSYGIPSEEKPRKGILSEKFDFENKLFLGKDSLDSWLTLNEYPTDKEPIFKEDSFLWRTILEG